MKLIFTVTEATHYVHVGGEIERVSDSIEIPDELLPDIVKEYFKDKQKAEENDSYHSYMSMSISIGPKGGGGLMTIKCTI